MKSKLFFFLFVPCCLAIAQDKPDPLTRLTARMQSYLDKSPVFYTHLFFAQDKFTPGDTVFFKAHFMDQSNEPVKGRAVMQLFLINATGKVADKILFNTKDGVGYSQLVLPDSLSAGRYRLVALNDWMRNFGAASFFEEEISVVRGKELRRKSEPVGVRFFAEGGQLVESIPNKVAVFSTRPNTQFTIADDSLREITTVSVDQRGIGFFVFTPLAGRSYSAVAVEGGARFALPVAQKDGVSMLLTANVNREPVRLLLAMPKTSRLREQDLSLLLIAGQQIHYSATLRFSDKEAITLAIPQKKLQEGIAQLLVVDDHNNVLANRCFLVQDYDSLKDTYRLSQSLVTQRTQLRLDAVLADHYRNPRKGELTVRAVNSSLFSASEKFRSPDPDRLRDVWTARFDPANAASINTRLIAFQGFYPWKDILAAPAEFVNPHPIRTMVHKKGRAVFKTTRMPVPDSTLISVYLQRHFIGYEAVTTKNGAFDLAFLFDFFGKDEMFFMAEFKGELLKDVALEWEDEIPGVFPSETPWEETTQPDALSAFAAKNKLVSSSYRFFSQERLAKKNALANPNAEFEDEFMGADVTVNVEDYVVFPTMEELIREVIPSLQHRRVRGNSTVRVVFSIPSILPTGDPVYIIDGVMTKNSDFFLSLRPVDILTVKIEKELSKLTRLGAIGKNGIVYVQTKKQDTSERLRAVNSIVPIQGLNKPVDKKWPIYGGEVNWRMPDFRSSVYWNPSVKADATGEATVAFFLGDDVGPVEISVQGFTEDGRPFSFTEVVQVNFAPASKN